MAKFEELTERVDRLLLRHQELKRTSMLIEEQLQAMRAERDSLRSRLMAARSRIEALIERVPTQPTPLGAPESGADEDAAEDGHKGDGA